MSEAFWAAMQPAPSTPDFQGMFNHACDQIGECLKTVIDKFNALIKHIYDNRFFLGPALLVLKGVLDKMRGAIDKVVELAKYVGNHQMPVLSLILQSFNWVQHVHSPMSNLSGPAGTWRVDNQNAAYWTGPAADAYNRAATGQKAAIDEYVKKAEFISSWLFTIAQTNVDFVAGLASMLSKVAANMVTTAAEGATVIELPFAADRLADTVSTLIEGGMSMLIEYGKNFVKALRDFRDAVSQQGDHTVFTNGGWPQAVRN
jgi:hypothetical protein